MLRSMFKLEKDVFDLIIFDQDPVFEGIFLLN